MGLTISLKGVDCGCNEGGNVGYKIKFIETEDEHDCDTCGSSWTTSSQMEVVDEAGRVVFSFGAHASASCFGSLETTREDCYREFVTWLGHSVEDTNE